MNKHNTKLLYSERSSHCMNCGIAVRHACKSDDPRANNEFCAFCGRLAGKLVDAEFRQLVAHEDLAAVVAQNLPAGVIANRSVMTKKECIEAEREKRVVLDSLRARKEEMRSKIAGDTRIN